jgi:hypothetical protein
VRQPAGRITIAAAVVIALLTVIFPPWRARAIRTTTRYAAVSGVAPATVIDTITWRLSAAPLFAPPRAPLPGSVTHALALRSMAGEPAARAELRRVMEPFEQRYHAPEIIRTVGEVWRDSVLAVAGVPAVSSYDASFAIDELGLAGRLIAVATIAAFVEYRRVRRQRARRDEDH